MRRILVALLGCVLGSAIAQAQTFAEAPFGPPQVAGTIADLRLDEISGIAASRRADGRYWVHDDSGNEPFLYALDARGALLGQVRVDDAANVDWEDIASFVLDGTPYLMVADSGDNAATRGHYELVVIAEPALPLPVHARVAPAWKLRYRFPDGAHDCEAVGVDVTTQTVILVTKRTDRPQVYSLPLRPRGDGEQVATRIATITAIPKPTAAERALKLNAARYGHEPTGLDIDPPGRRAALLTYRNAYVFTRADGQSWAQAFTAAPALLRLPLLPQAEAIGFDREGRSLLVTGEGLPVPLLRFDPGAPPTH
ncbi:MAG: hypothetical protein ABFC67_07550 [Mizugakiibacter sp.]|uniref:hypothetical protein n=1 Tax=Mizugakiibacter sp. TaxID=1972610 RepID=UPI0031C9C12B|nr:hypothetical protein [Xanthomonadaceae bacterium]